MPSKAKKCKKNGGKVVYLFNNNSNRSNRGLPCKKVCCLKRKKQ